MTYRDVPTVMVVDDEPANIALVKRLLESEGYEVIAATDGESALNTLAHIVPDVVLLDVRMPGIDGLEVCRRIRENPTTRHTPTVMITGLNARQHKIEAIDVGADDLLVKPFDVEELRARVRSLIRLKRQRTDLESAERIILSLALTVEARDAYTDGHCQRLATYSVAFGRALRLPAEDLDALYRGGYFHDVGKIGVPDAVLQKPGKLTPTEFDQMKGHTIIGERLCGNLRSLSAVKPIVRHHHECLDGSGYPDGLRGGAVPLLAQIVSVADAYDAMTTTRPYRVALRREDAHEELRADAARGIRDRALVEAFIELDLGGGFSASVGAEINRPGAAREGA